MNDFKYKCDTCTGDKCNYCDAKRLWQPNGIYFYIENMHRQLAAAQERIKHLEREREIVFVETDETLKFDLNDEPAYSTKQWNQLQEENARLRNALEKILEEQEKSYDACISGCKEFVNVSTIARTALSTPPSSALAELVEAVGEINNNCDGFNLSPDNLYKVRQAYAKVVGK